MNWLVERDNLSILKYALPFAADWWGCKCWLLPEGLVIMIVEVSWSLEEAEISELSCVYRLAVMDGAWILRFHIKLMHWRITRYHHGFAFILLRIFDAVEFAVREVWCLLHVSCTATTTAWLIMSWLCWFRTNSSTSCVSSLTMISSLLAYFGAGYDSLTWKLWHTKTATATVKWCSECVRLPWAFRLLHQQYVTVVVIALISVEVMFVHWKMLSEKRIESTGSSYLEKGVGEGSNITLC
jgi:hypothetical protein